ncbi:MAG: sigma-70 family RNA polymerase sigma factor [Xenococcaceae cyanobacterium]
MIQQSRKLWWERSPHYEDALQQTWLYFCRNLCESVTTTAYNPDLGSVITWLNSYLKFRLRDLNIEKAIDDTTRIQTSDEEFDLIAQIPAPAEVPPLLQDLRAWAEADRQGKLRKTHLRDRLDINAQALILYRLPPETAWTALSKRFGVPVSTLSTFYQRKCLPFLRSFCDAEGYGL